MLSLASMRPCLHTAKSTAMLTLQSDTALRSTPTHRSYVRSPLPAWAPVSTAVPEVRREPTQPLTSPLTPICTHPCQRGPLPPQPCRRCSPTQPLNSSLNPSPFCAHPCQHMHQSPQPCRRCSPTQPLNSSLNPSPFCTRPCQHMHQSPQPCWWWHCTLTQPLNSPQTPAPVCAHPCQRGPPSPQPCRWCAGSRAAGPRGTCAGTGPPWAAPAGCSGWHPAPGPRRLPGPERALHPPRSAQHSVGQG